MLRQCLQRHSNHSLLLPRGAKRWRVRIVKINTEPPTRLSPQLLEASRLGRRFLRTCLVTLGVIGMGYTMAVASAHAWVENVGIQMPPGDEDVRKWEWDTEAERWSGNLGGGTDPGLGYNGRIMVRRAWMATTWTNEEVGARYTEKGDLEIILPDIVEADNCLRQAIVIAESSPDVDPQTLPVLLKLHASVLERFGNDHLVAAKDELERAWNLWKGSHLQAAQIALKLGDICHRLQDSKMSLSWWSRAIALSTNTAFTETLALSVPAQIPASPYAQRIITSTMVSVSQYLSISGNLKDAQKYQEGSLALIRSIPHPASLSSASASQSLHHLTLLQRSSVLSEHLAEVLYALDMSKNRTSYSSYLSSAAESSERVVSALLNVPLSDKNTITDLIKADIPSPKVPVADRFKSLYLRKKARDLVRHSRQSAYSSWNILGLVFERENNTAMAMLCYMRSLKWASSTPNFVQDTDAVPGPHTLPSDWALIHDNTLRLAKKRVM